jgi:hypothetical protein
VDFEDIAEFQDAFTRERVANLDRTDFGGPWRRRAKDSEDLRVPVRHSTRTTNKGGASEATAPTRRYIAQQVRYSGSTVES